MVLFHENEMDNVANFSYDFRGCVDKTSIATDDDGVSNWSSGCGGRGYCDSISRRCHSSSFGDSSIKLDGLLLEGTEGLRNGRVDCKDHSLSTMSSYSLFAVPPGGLQCVDSVIPRRRRNNRVVDICHKA